MFRIIRNTVAKPFRVVAQFTMAVSNMGCGRKSYKRYKFFFYTAGFIVVMQLYMGYSFYSMNQSDLEEIRKAETRKRNIEINFNKTKITHQSEVIRETQVGILTVLLNLSSSSPTTFPT